MRMRRRRYSRTLRALGIRNQRPWRPRGAWKYQSMRSFGMSLMPVLFLFGRSFTGWIMAFGRMIFGGKKRI